MARAAGAPFVAVGADDARRHVDADREMAGQDVLRSGGVWRPRRACNCVARGRPRRREDPAPPRRRRVHLPALAAERLQDEDVVRILVQVQSLRAGRRDVGVDLTRMPELQLEVTAEARDRLGPAMQALEHDRRAVFEERRDASGVRDPCDLPRTCATRSRVGGLRDLGAGLHEPEERRAERGRREEPVDVVEREQVLEPGGRRGCRRRGCRNGPPRRTAARFPQSFARNDPGSPVQRSSGPRPDRTRSSVPRLTTCCRSRPCRRCRSRRRPCRRCRPGRRRRRPSCPWCRRPYRRRPSGRDRSRPSALVTVPGITVRMSSSVSSCVVVSSMSRPPLSSGIPEPRSCRTADLVSGARATDRYSTAAGRDAPRGQPWRSS